LASHGHGAYNRPSSPRRKAYSSHRCPTEPWRGSHRQNPDAGKKSSRGGSSPQKSEAGERAEKPLRDLLPTPGARWNLREKISWEGRGGFRGKTLLKKSRRPIGRARPILEDRPGPRKKRRWNDSLFFVNEYRSNLLTGTQPSSVTREKKRENGRDGREPCGPIRSRLGWGKLGSNRLGREGSCNVKLSQNNEARKKKQRTNRPDSTHRGGKQKKGNSLTSVEFREKKSRSGLRRGRRNKKGHKKQSTTFYHHPSS